jgi:hypothetical protein
MNDTTGSGNHEQSGSLAEQDASTTAATKNNMTSKPPHLTSSSTSLGLERASSTGASSTASQRTLNFTEAVPLSLSSMAHASLVPQLNNGVTDGIVQVLGHTLLSCVNYARIMHPPHDWTFADLCTSPFAWTALKQDVAEAELPFALMKLKFCHYYTKTAHLYLRPALMAAQQLSSWTCPEDEFQFIINNNWPQRMGVLACIKLLYASTEPLTRDELNGIGTGGGSGGGDDGDVSMEDNDIPPPTILYKVVVEYRSLPATGNVVAVAAEELSMLSFGNGSVDDTVKYGALASLYDATAPYVLEIYSVRGKKYKFDLMDATLSNGTVPRLLQQPTTLSTSTSSQENDPFVKSLCVTVTNHTTETDVHQQQGGNDDNKNKKKAPYAITRMHLTLEGKLRGGEDALNNLPMINDVSNSIAATFRALDPREGRLHNNNMTASSRPSGHVLLLDPQQAGRVYVNGRFITMWGDVIRNQQQQQHDARGSAAAGCCSSIDNASHGEALFGMDLQNSVPVWLNRIVDYHALRKAYGQLWQDVLIDANLLPLQIASRLLHRLLSGKDPPDATRATSRRKGRSSSHNDDDEDEYDDNDDDDIDDDGYDDDDSMTLAAATTTDCLESQVLSSPEYDMVGIAAKALATRFATEFGKLAFPCQAHEVEFCRVYLPARRPLVVVPQRLICILRRGGYFDAQRTLDDLWFQEQSMISLDRMCSTTSCCGEKNNAAELVTTALDLLEAAGCEDISPQQVSFVLDEGDGTVYPGCIASRGKEKNVVIAEKVVCRYKEVSQQYCIHADFLKANVMEYTDTPGDEGLTNKVRAYLLGMYLAQAHPDGTMLARYLLRNKAPTGTAAVSSPSSSAQALSSPSSPSKSLGTFIDI